jgi:hypothetical protein
MQAKKKILLFTLPVLVSFILHFRVINIDLIGYHVWRQTQTQTVIYNFSDPSSSIFHPQKFDVRNGTNELLYEFPLYQWSVAKLNTIMGYSVAHSRLFSFFAFCLLLIGFYKLVRSHTNERYALAVNAALCFSPLLYYYCINPLPDILALALGVWSLFFLISYLKQRRYIHLIFSVVIWSVATLVKLPFIIMAAPILPFYFGLIKEKNYGLMLKIAATYFLAVIPPLLWYMQAIPTWKGNGITEGMFNNQKNWITILDYMQFHLISSLPELLTNYAACAFLFAGTYYCIKHFKRSAAVKTYFPLVILTVIYFLFEVNMIEKTHDYYLMPFIPLVFLVVAKGIQVLYESKFKIIVFVGLALVPLTAWLRIDHRWNTNEPGFNTDYLNYGNYLQTKISDKDLCIIDFDESRFISLYYLKRNGYSLSENELNEALLTELYNKGAKYLITENLSLNLNSFSTFNFQQIFKNNLCVYLISKK